MTEKICDVILGGATPIYIGASKINEFYESEIYSINPLNSNLEQIINNILEYLGRDQSSAVKRSQKFETLFGTNFYYHVSKILNDKI
jgi:hypothetical protein